MRVAPLRRGLDCKSEHIKRDSSPWAWTPINPIGRLTTEYAANSTGWLATDFSYDQMGRVMINDQCTPIHCNQTYSFQSYYGYDLAGNMTSSQVNTGDWLNYSYNVASRLTSVTSALSDANHPGTLLTVSHYNAFGSELSGTLGNNLALARTYDGRGRLLTMTDGPAGSPVYKLASPNGTNGLVYAPNGDVINANDSNGTWNLAYDDFNRLLVRFRAHRGLQGSRIGGHIVYFCHLLEASDEAMGPVGG